MPTIIWATSWENLFIEQQRRKSACTSMQSDQRLCCSLPWWYNTLYLLYSRGERGGSVVECRTPEREVRGSRPTAAVLCSWARHFTPRKYWLITQEAMAPSRHDWKIVDWDVKPQHNQPTKLLYSRNFETLASLCSWAGRFESYLVPNPRRQVFSWRVSFVIIIMCFTLCSVCGWYHLYL